jgi:hypothetical protein
VDLGEVHITHVIGAVIVTDLATSPVYTFDLDDFVVLDCAD